MRTSSGHPIKKASCECAMKKVLIVDDSETIRREVGRCLGRAHRGSNSVQACFVRRRGNDSSGPDAADDDGLASKRGLVPLLDGGEEGIEIEMHDRSRGPHGHSLSPPGDTVR